jgi:hypothetical protein
VAGGGQIDDGEAAVGEGDPGFGIGPVVAAVRPPVKQGLPHGGGGWADFGLAKTPVSVKKASNAAHRQ